MNRMKMRRMMRRRRHGFSVMCCDVRREGDR
jgi:hypothetical protein